MAPGTGALVRIEHLAIRGGAEAATLVLGAAADTGEASLARPPRASCWAARFLTGPGRTGPWPGAWGPLGCSIPPQGSAVIRSAVLYQWPFKCPPNFAIRPLLAVLVPGSLGTATRARGGGRVCLRCDRHPQITSPEEVLRHVARDAHFLRLAGCDPAPWRSFWAHLAGGREERGPGEVTPQSCMAGARRALFYLYINCDSNI